MAEGRNNEALAKHANAAVRRGGQRDEGDQVLNMIWSFGLCRVYCESRGDRILGTSFCTLGSSNEHD